MFVASVGFDFAASSNTDSITFTPDVTAVFIKTSVALSILTLRKAVPRFTRHSSPYAVDNVLSNKARLSAKLYRSDHQIRSEQRQTESISITRAEGRVMRISPVLTLYESADNACAVNSRERRDITCCASRTFDMKPAVKCSVRDSLSTVAMSAACPLLPASSSSSSSPSLPFSFLLVEVDCHHHISHDKCRKRTRRNGSKRGNSSRTQHLPSLHPACRDHEFV